MTKTLTNFSQKLFFRFIFIYIQPWERNSNNNRIFFINFVKTLRKRSHNNFNNEQLKPKNNFFKAFQDMFFNSRLFKALKTDFFNSML